MKKIFAAVLAATLFFTVWASCDNRESVIICSMMDQIRNDALQERLNEHFPEDNIIVTYLPTGKAATKVFHEKTDTEIDMLLSMDFAYLNKLTPYLAKIDGVSNIDYLPEFSPEANRNLWVTWEKFAGAIIVNRDTLRRLGLEAPTDYRDLLKPEYRGLIVMPDPKSSGTGYFFYQSWVNSWGEEQALAYMDALYPNLKQFTDSGNGPTKLLKQGEAAIGLGMTFQAVMEINRGVPLEIIFPENGSPYSLAGTALLKGREQDPKLREIFSYIVNDFFIYDKEHYSPDTIYKNQRNLVPNYPKDIPYADMTGILDAAEKERLLAKWKY